MAYMNPSNAYWAPPPLKQTFLKPFFGTGFLINLPYPDPVFSPSTGEGAENILGKEKELVFTTLPETFAVADILPMTGGVPRVDPNSFAGTHTRAAYTRRV